METVIVVSIVGVALLYLAHRLWKLKSKGPTDCCGNENHKHSSTHNSHNCCGCCQSANQNRETPN